MTISEAKEILDRQPMLESYWLNFIVSRNGTLVDRDAYSHVGWSWSCSVRYGLQSKRFNGVANSIGDCVTAITASVSELASIMSEADKTFREEKAK